MLNNALLQQQMQFFLFNIPKRFKMSYLRQKWGSHVNNIEESPISLIFSISCMIIIHFISILNSSLLKIFVFNLLNMASNIFQEKKERSFLREVGICPFKSRYIMGFIITNAGEIHLKIMQRVRCTGKFNLLCCLKKILDKVYVHV